MMLTEEIVVLAETCPGATSSNVRPTGTDGPAVYSRYPQRTAQATALFRKCN